MVAVHKSTWVGLTKPTAKPVNTSSIWNLQYFKYFKKPIFHILLFQNILTFFSVFIFGGKTFFGVGGVDDIFLRDPYGQIQTIKIILQSKIIYDEPLTHEWLQTVFMANVLHDNNIRRSF